MSETRLTKHIFHNQKTGAAKLEPEDEERNLHPVVNDGPKTDWQYHARQAVKSLLTVFGRKIIQTP